MAKPAGHSILIGSLLLVLVVVVLVTGPDELFYANTYFIDTELNRSSGQEVPVRTKMDLGNLEQFPLRIGDWVGYDNRDAASLKESLGADALYKRTYVKEYAVPLLIIAGSSMSNFHPPIVCYPNLGYKIEEEGKDIVYIKDASWVERAKEIEIDISKLTEREKQEIRSHPTLLGDRLSVKKLVVFKKDGSNITDRRVVLYVYVKENPTSTKYMMLRGEALAPTTGSYEDSLNAVKELMSEAVPLMFEPHKPGKMVIQSLAESGAVGYFVILLLIATPLAILFYPICRARKIKHTKA